MLLKLLCINNNNSKSVKNITNKPSGNQLSNKILSFMPRSLIISALIIKLICYACVIMCILLTIYLLVSCMIELNYLKLFMMINDIQLNNSLDSPDSLDSRKKKMLKAYKNKEWINFAISTNKTLFLWITVLPFLTIFCMFLGQYVISKYSSDKLNQFLLQQVNNMSPKDITGLMGEINLHIQNIINGFKNYTNFIFKKTAQAIVLIVLIIGFILFTRSKLLMACFTLWFIVYIINIYIFLPRIIKLDQKYTIAAIKYKQTQAEVLVRHKTYYLYNATEYSKELIQQAQKTKNQVFHKWQKPKSNLCFYSHAINIIYMALNFICLRGALKHLERLAREVEDEAQTETKMTANETIMLLYVYCLTLLFFPVTFYIYYLSHNITRSLTNLTSSWQTIVTSVNVLNAIPQKRPDGTVDLKKFDTVTFKDVVAFYGNKKLFKPLNLTINRGDSVAIIGTSGCGKTSLIDTLMGFAYNYYGQILINGKDIVNYKEYSIRNNVTFAQQDASLLSATVKDNISMGCQFTDKQLHNALIASKYYNDTAMGSVLDALTYQVNGNGSNLSGGQAQRLKLARLFLHNNPNKIFIADEPTSALDPILAKECMNNIIQAAEQNQQICLVITHDIHLASLLFKKILFFYEGVWYYGSHQELYEKHDFYRDLFNKSTKKN